MVCSQVYSQHPSRCLLSVAHQGRSWGSSNAEMRFLEVETGEGDGKGNSACRGYSRPSNSCVCPGYTSTSSPIKSSWIQRLIPANITRVEQAQLKKSLPIEREGFNGLQADWSLDRNESGFALYENRRRSRQDFYSNQESLLGNTTTCNEHIVSPSGRICKPLEALQPKVQIPPRTLPVVECLLNPGCTKNSLKPHVSMEAKKSHDLFRFSGFSNPIKQAVYFSADERSRVSCSSIDGLSFRSGRCVAGDLNASLGGEKCFNALQPTLDFSFNHPEAALRSNTHAIYCGRKVQNCTYSGMDNSNGPQIEGQVVSNCSGSRDPVSFTGRSSMETRYRTDESRSLGRSLMSYKDRCIDSFPQCFMQTNLSMARTGEGLNAEERSMQTRSNRNVRHVQEQQQDGKGAMFAFEVSCGKRSASSGGGCLNPGLGKDGSQRMSDLVASHVRGKASISLAPCLIEQELGPSQVSHKEQDVTSGSFSFYSKSRLSYGSADAKVVTERGDWPFCGAKPYLKDLVQARVQKNWRTRDIVEASRPEMSFNRVFTTQLEGDNPCFSRSQSSPFFGTKPLTADYGRNRLASEDDCRWYKPMCMDNGGVYSEELKTEALYKHDVNQDAGVKQEKASLHNDGIIFSRIQSDSTIKGVEEREQKYSYPSSTIDRVNWKGLRPPFRIDTLTVGSCLNRSADLGTQDLAANTETNNTLTMLEGPVALPSARLEEHSRGFSVGSGLHKAAHVPKSGERGAKSSVSRQTMWLRRWSTTRAREERTVLKSNRERSIVHSRRLVENDDSTSQSSWESSHRFDLRPAKRACYGQRIGLHSEPCQANPVMGSLAVGREDQNGLGVASHFMKRFLAPSAAAMAIMGMTARRMHATNPQRGGLFGVWPVKSSTNKCLTEQVEVGKDVLTRQEDKMHSLEKPSSTHVDVSKQSNE